MSMDKIITIEEKIGDKYPDLNAVQRLALADFVSCLVPVIHELIERKELVIRDGQIITNSGGCIMSKLND